MFARLSALVFTVLFLAVPVRGQDLTAVDRTEGYLAFGDTTLFVFDAALYGVNPDRVVVTGAFRGWSQDMDDPAWALSKGPAGLWTLAVPNSDYRVIGPSSPFKYRVDDGRWLDPPSGAENVEGGNLVFLHGISPPRLRAELRGPRTVWIELSGVGIQRPDAPSAYRVVRWDGEVYTVESLAPDGETDGAILTLTDSLALNQVHYVEAQAPDEIRGLASFDGLWRNLWPDTPLGAHVVDTCPECAGLRLQTSVTLFAPRADSVRVHFYDEATGPERESHALHPGQDGIWHWMANGFPPADWYDFSVFGPDGPGSHFTNQTGQRVSDPYALVSDDSWGRARIWRDDFEPATPLPAGRPPMEEVIAYEVHVQDFTDRLPLADDLRGTIPGMAVRGLTNSRGEAIGFDYLVDLGVNVVHLMPIQEYLHYPDEVWQAAFADDALMQEQGIADENYQWGYRITHYMAVESRYRQRGTPPGAEREQFRDLVQAFHDQGMAVIVDFVFNHTGENMEGTQQLLNFNGIDKWYYYRLDTQGEHIGVFGNEVKSENRPMVRQWLLDQCRMYIEAFGVDGFRIDLAGQTDEATLRWLREQLPDDILWYGEPWIGSNDPDFEANPEWDWYKADSPITFFQDDARNAFKGPTSHPDGQNLAASRGFAGGDGSVREAVKNALLNRYPDEATPNTGINYLDIHDNWALPDRFAACTEGDCAWDGRQGVDESAIRIAATLLLTSLGPVVINGGTEMLRSKGHAPLPGTLGGQLVKETAMTPIYINGRGDTYNLRTANQYDWETVGATPQDGAAADYAGMLAWWKGLIAFRRSEVGAVFRRGTTPPDGYYQFLEPENPAALGYLVDDAVLVLLNPSDEAVTFEIPSGRWTPIADDTRVDPDGLGWPVDVTDATPITLPSGGVRLWVRE